jgi:predicted lipoprotein with Yx(FWY)xxD motif
MGGVRKLVVLLSAPVALIAIAGCGGGGSSASTSATTATGASSSSAATTGSGAPATGTAQISTRTLSGLGTVLVDGQGRTLYVFMPDAHRRVTCLGACVQLWPPVKLAQGQKPAVSGQAKSALLGSDPDPEGGRVLTYAGWPLYTYIADSGPGSDNGQGLNTNGGLWYVISSTGAVISKTP